MKASKKRVQMTIYLDPEVRDRLEKIQHETYVKTGVYKASTKLLQIGLKAMSKSIYEEALEIIKPMNAECYEFNVPLDTFEIPIQALEQAQKQEQLLEHYKKLSNLYEEIYGVELSLLSLNLNYYETEIIKLKQQIKDIENE